MMMGGIYYLMRFFSTTTTTTIPVCFLFYLDSLTDLPDLSRRSDMNMIMTSTCSRMLFFTVCVVEEVMLFMLSLSLSFLQIGYGYGYGDGDRCHYACVAQRVLKEEDDKFR